MPKQKNLKSIGLSGISGKLNSCQKQNGDWKKGRSQLLKCKISKMMLVTTSRVIKTPTSSKTNSCTTPLTRPQLRMAPSMTIMKLTPTSTRKMTIRRTKKTRRVMKQLPSKERKRKMRRIQSPPWRCLSQRQHLWRRPLPQNLEQRPHPQIALLGV